MSDHATAVDQAIASRSPAAPAVASEPVLLPDAMTQDDLSATAMSIDTPSYACSLAVGQLGFPAVASNPFSVSESLSEAMSIDGQQQMPFWDAAAANTSGEHIFTICCCPLIVCLSAAAAAAAASVICSELWSGLLC